MKFKRDLVKYVRDKAKSQYKKENECYICGNTDNLDLFIEASLKQGIE